MAAVVDILWLDVADVLPFDVPCGVVPVVKLPCDVVPGVELPCGVPDTVSVF